MTTETLSPPALAVIHNYLHLPFADQDVSCPYFNNRRQKVRGALRVLIGKGTAEDIVEEARIIALREKINLQAMGDEHLKQFLVDHHIGIDCSGLVYHVLDMELKSRKGKRLRQILRFPAKNPLRKLLIHLRPAENTNVQTLSDPVNSVKVKLNDVRPGDLIVMKKTGREKTLDHVLLVHKVEKDNGVLKKIHYTNSFQWSTDGKYHHGVRQGMIIMTDINQTLLHQTWEEQEKTNEANETWLHAKLAEELSLRRLCSLA